MSGAPLLTHTLPRPRGVPQVQNIHHFQRAPLTCCRTFVTFKKHFRHFVEHSLVLTMCLFKCEHSYTELKQICQIFCDIRHVANGCVSKVLTPPWFAKLDLSDMQNIRHIRKCVLWSVHTVTQNWNVDAKLSVTFVTSQKLRCCFYLRGHSGASKHKTAPLLKHCGRK